MYVGLDRAASEKPTDASSNEQRQIRVVVETGTERGKQMHAIPRFRSLERLTEMSRSLQGIELATLAPFDTIVVRTVNSDYRISLLDPETGRALLEGGLRLNEPVEASIIGSSFGGSLLRTGWIGVGLRMEACANDRYIRTSPIQSISIEHQDSPEPHQICLK